jgi:hypothetical protein
MHRFNLRDRYSALHNHHESGLIFPTLLIDQLIAPTHLVWRKAYQFVDGWARRHARVCGFFV